MCRGLIVSIISHVITRKFFCSRPPSPGALLDVRFCQRFSLRFWESKSRRFRDMIYFRQRRFSSLMNLCLQGFTLFDPLNNTTDCSLIEFDFMMNWFNNILIINSQLNFKFIMNDQFCFKTFKNRNNFVVWILAYPHGGNCKMVLYESKKQNHFTFKENIFFDFKSICHHQLQFENNFEIKLSNNHAPAATKRSQTFVTRTTKERMLDVGWGIARLDWG